MKKLLIITATLATICFLTFAETAKNYSNQEKIRLKIYDMDGNFITMFLAVVEPGKDGQIILPPERLSDNYKYLGYKLLDIKSRSIVYYSSSTVVNLIVEESR